jgi:hypothetical protein
MPLMIGGGVIGVVLIGLLIFLGVHALGGNDNATADPTNQPTGAPTTGAPTTGAPTTPGGDPTGGPPADELGDATGQAKGATDKLQALKYQCSDLFNGPQGAHRGCFKYAGATAAEVVFQFQSDGTIIGVLVRSSDTDNINNAAVTFDAALQAVGNDTFGGSEVAKVQQAVKTGQKSGKVGSTWGEFDLRNSGDELRLSGGRSGSESLDLPRKEFQSTEATLTAGFKAKGYACTTSCRKQVGQYGSQSVFGIGSNGGLRSIEMRASGEPAEVKTAMPAVTADTFAVLKGPDVAALKAWIAARSDGRSYAGYVSGWRVEITGKSDTDYASKTVDVTYESFYV